MSLSLWAIPVTLRILFWNIDWCSFKKQVCPFALNAFLWSGSTMQVHFQWVLQLVQLPSTHSISTTLGKVCKQHTIDLCSAVIVLLYRTIFTELFYLSSGRQRRHVSQRLLSQSLYLCIESCVELDNEDRQIAACWWLRRVLSERGSGLMLSQDKTSLTHSTSFKEELNPVL